MIGTLVVERGNFTAAAKELNLTQPAVGAASWLEGSDDFHRAPRVHHAAQRRGPVAARGARIRNLILDEAIERAYLPKTLCFHQ